MFEPLLALKSYAVATAYDKNNEQVVSIWFIASLGPRYTHSRLNLETNNGDKGWL